MSSTNLADKQLHLTISTAWFKFIEYCKAIGHGEIEKLKIQDGVPMMAEKVTKKIKFN